METLMDVLTRILEVLTCIVLWPDWLEIGKLLVPFLAAFIGALLAYRNIEKKHAFDDEINKVKEANKVFLLLSRCLRTLLEQRQLYQPTSERNNSVMRGFTIRAPFGDYPMADSDLSALTFMVPSFEAQNAKQESNYFDLMAMESLLEDYNTCVTSWKKRNDKFREVSYSLLSSEDAKENILNTSKQVDAKLIVKHAGKVQITELLVATELTINLTERLITHFGQIIEAFPALAKNAINLNILNNKYHLLASKPDSRVTSSVRPFTASEVVHFLNSQLSEN